MGAGVYEDMIKTLISKIKLPFIVVRRSTFAGLEDEVMYLEELVYSLRAQLTSMRKAKSKSKKANKK